MLTPEEALRLRGRVLRQASRRLMMAAIARHLAFMGGWFGEPDEVVRFLMFFDYTYEKRLMSEERFTEEWPHHGMIPVPGWAERPQWQN